MLKAGLIGEPVSHSLSRVMHNAAFAHLGIDAVYDLWETPLADLPGRVETLRLPDMLGANVTVPHKQAVIPLVDELSVVAQRVGAVNTIIPRAGLLVGDNTDAYGFARSLDEAATGRVPGRAVVVGAGGASRAVLVALQDAGVPEIVLVNRTPSRAAELAEDLSLPGAAPIEVGEFGRLVNLAQGADVLINATSVGWHGDELPFDREVLQGLSPQAVVVDLTYRETSLLRLALASGLAVLDGLPMLIHQGARSFELWTGQDAPLDVMRGAVVAEQERRSLVS